MGINPAEPAQPFDAFWGGELPVVAPPSKVIGKYYGKAFTIKAITESLVTIASPDVGGLVDIPKRTFEIVYTDWRNYRYENLSLKNSQNILHVVSIIDYIIQTWVRREGKVEQIEKARKAEIPDQNTDKYREQIPRHKYRQWGKVSLPPSAGFRRFLNKNQPT